MFQKKSYNTLTGQTFQYLARPHQSICREQIHSAAAWKGMDIRETGEWIYQLNPSEITDIQRAVAHAESRHKPTKSLTKDDFPLRVLPAKIRQWQLELDAGRGFQLIRGAPVNEWTESQVEVFFWCLGLHLGIPGTQNPQGELLGHVRDTLVEEDKDAGRFYKTSKNINYHCDAADVVGLLCLKRAKEGGHSRIVSSVTVYNQLLEKHPDIIDRLYQPFHLDTHGEGGVATLPIQPCCYYDGKLRTFFHSDYFRSAFNLKNISPMTKEESVLLDAYEAIAENPDNCLDMDLEPGDIQLVSNHSVLHARTAYVDHENSADRRHLLRLWLTLKADHGLKARIDTEIAKLSLLRDVVPAKLKGLFE